MFYILNFSIKIEDCVVIMGISTRGRVHPMVHLLVLQIIWL